MAIFRALLGAPGVALVVFGLYDRWLWKFGPVGTPILAGTWRGTIRSSWRNPQTNEKIPPIEIFMIVRQTASSITMTQLSRESRSGSITATINRNADGQHDVAWAYRNEPLKAVAHRSQMHYGGAFISGVSRRRPERLEGRYWTERGTTGDLELWERTTAPADSYEEAQRLFASSPAKASAPTTAQP
jgi:hypothetical protein